MSGSSNSCNSISVAGSCVAATEVGIGKDPWGGFVAMVGIGRCTGYQSNRWGDLG
jgi:hypothetical protein